MNTIFLTINTMANLDHTYADICEALLLILNNTEILPNHIWVQRWYEHREMPGELRQFICRHVAMGIDLHTNLKFGTNLTHKFTDLVGNKQGFVSVDYEGYNRPMGFHKKCVVFKPSPVWRPQKTGIVDFESIQLMKEKLIPHLSESLKQKQIYLPSPKAVYSDLLQLSKLKK